MQGVNKSTYQAISPELHLQQSVLDIITTPINTRVMRRDYGSILPDLLDAPQNGTTAMRLIAGVAHAVKKWEPRVQRITQVNFAPQSDGQQHITIKTDQGDLELPLTDNGVAYGNR